MSEIDSARLGHQIDDDFIGDTVIDRDIVTATSSTASIFEDPCLSVLPCHVFRRRVDQKVDVFRGARAAVNDDGESSDEDVTSAFVVQRATDPGEIFDLRFACVTATIRVIHASASSKLLKR